MQVPRSILTKMAAGAGGLALATALGFAAHGLTATATAQPAPHTPPAAAPSDDPSSSDDPAPTATPTATPHPTLRPRRDPCLGCGRG